MRWTQKPPLGVSINRAHPLAKGLVGCWLFNESGGDSVYDLSGNGNHGTLISMAFPPTTSSGWNPGPAGSVLAFDGANDYVSLPNTDVLRPTQGAVAAWVKLDTTGDRVIFAAGNAAGANPYMMLMFSGANALRIWTQADGNQTWAIQAFNDGNWHHILFQSDGAFWHCWHDGIKETPVANTAWLASQAYTSVAIGILDRGGDYAPYDGQISQVMEWDRFLSDDEILDLYIHRYAMFEWPTVLQWYVAAVVGNPWYYYAQQQ